MLDIEKYNDKNVAYLKKYFRKKEMKMTNKLIRNLEIQEVKTRITNKQHLVKLDKLDDLTPAIIWIDNLELFLLDGTINEPPYKNIKKLIEDSSRSGLMLYTKAYTIQKVLDIYRSNMDVLDSRIKTYYWNMKHMKAQERTLKKFVKILYTFDFTKAKNMPVKEIERFFKSKFKEFEFM